MPRINRIFAVLFPDCDPVERPIFCGEDEKHVLLEIGCSLHGEIRRTFSRLFRLLCIMCIDRMRNNVIVIVLFVSNQGGQSRIMWEYL